MDKPYRLNAGMIVFNSSGQVLAGDRIQYPGHFQFPQGGIDDGEDPETAAIRELYEEIGLQPGRPVGEIPGWLTYEFPEDIPDHLKKFRGQKQKWFYFRWDGQPSELDLEWHEREFNTVRWMELTELVQNIIPFKQQVYREIQKHARRFIPEYLKM
ncbi:MAG: RNA pyrophosphohydrolase [Spirochaetaceae bacterium]|nr:RNA pyrophosphohydrolase [Spirochaetaceae bacterium]|tara:strand:+ start:60816 stop:61283 length:468 start_codon:yes stop_codon:yes gene_type:complete